MRSKLLVLLLCLIIHPCKSINTENSSQIKGSGKVIEKEITTSDYTTIDAESVIQIIYEQHPEKAAYLTLEIDDNLLEYVVIDNENDVLKITTSVPILTDKFKVYTNSKTLKSIRMSGISVITLGNKVKGEGLKIMLSGYSKLRASHELRVDNLNLKAIGMAEIYIQHLDTHNAKFLVSGHSNGIVEGKTNNVRLIISGESHLDASKLKCKVADIKGSGSSSIAIQVSDTLNALVLNASNIRYVGDPKIKSISRSDSFSQR